MSAVAQRADNPKTDDAFEGVYFLPIDDEYELRIARAWFEEKYGERAKSTGWPKMARTIPLPKLNQRAIVVPVIRGEDRTPAIRSVRESNGASYQERVPLKNLAGEVRECPRVRVGDFWETARDDWDAFGGNLQRGPFLEALGKSSSPIRPNIHIGNEHELRLTFL